ncbi:hypothetical protein Hanom_Chr13g01198621 [Helianthus anomalus]
MRKFRVRRSSISRGLTNPFMRRRKKPSKAKDPRLLNPPGRRRLTPPPKLLKLLLPLGWSAATVHRDATNAAGGAGAASGAGGSMPQTIGPKDTVGDIYYKTYTEDARGNVPHQAPWGLK